MISFFSRSHTVQAIEFAIPVSSMHAAFSSPASPPSLVASSCSSSLNVRPITSSSIQPGTWQWPSPFYFCFQNLPMIPVRMKNTPFWIRDLRPQRICHLPRIRSLVSSIIQKVCITVWKFQDFSITQILRENNFGDCINSKCVILISLRAMYFDFS